MREDEQRRQCENCECVKGSVLTCGGQQEGYGESASTTGETTLVTYIQTCIHTHNI